MIFFIQPELRNNTNQLGKQAKYMISVEEYELGLVVDKTTESEKSVFITLKSDLGIRHLAAYKTESEAEQVLEKVMVKIQTVPNANYIQFS